MFWGVLGLFAAFAAVAWMGFEVGANAEHRRSMEAMKDIENAVDRHLDMCDPIRAASKKPQGQDLPS